MSAPGSHDKPTKRSEQYIENFSFDEKYGVSTTEILGQDTAANALRRMQVDTNGFLKILLMAEDADTPGTFQPVQGQFNAQGKFVMLSGGYTAPVFTHGYMVNGLKTSLMLTHGYSFGSIPSVTDGSPIGIFPHTITYSTTSGGGGGGGTPAVGEAIGLFPLSITYGSTGGGTPGTGQSMGTFPHTITYS